LQHRMRILSRYLLRQHAAPFVFALTATTAIMLLNQIAKRFADLVGKGLPRGVIAEVFTLSVPFIVAMTIPMAVLVAVLYALSRLSSDNELTALKATGISLGQLIRPILLAGAAVSVLSFLFSDHVLPRSNHRLRMLLADIARKKPTFALKEQVVNEVKPATFFLRSGRIDQRTMGLRDVTIYDVADQDRSRVTYADSGSLAATENQENLYITLYHGTMHEFSRYDPKLFQQTDFDREVIKVAGVGNELDRSTGDAYKGDREMSICEMDRVISSARRERVVYERRANTIQRSDLRRLVGLAPLSPDTTPPARRANLYCFALEKFAAWLVPQEAEAQQVRGSRARPVLGRETLERFNEPGRQAYLTGTVPTPRWSEVQGFRDRARGARIREANYLVEAHKKAAIALAAIVFVLIAVPTALRFPRGGVGLVIGASMGVFTLYYIGLIAGESLANRLVAPPTIMWAPNILFTLVGVLLLWRTRFEAAPRRAGT